MAFVLAALCLGAVACTPVSTQDAERQGAPTPAATAEPAAEQAGERVAAVDPTPAQQATPNETQADELDTEDDDANDDRGSRVGSDQEPEAAATEPSPEAQPSAEAETGTETETAPTPAPTAVTEPSPVEPTATAMPATPTPVPTTAPVPIPQPLATAAPATAVPVPTASQDPDAAFTAPAPTGPVPSDDIVVQGPDVDESQPVVISDNGASACALAESAIDLLDVGDLSRAGSVLQDASVIAAQASEPEIAAVASELAAAGANEDAAIAAIIATLNACAIHGYQV